MLFRFSLTIDRFQRASRVFGDASGGLGEETFLSFSELFIQAEDQHEVAGGSRLERSTKSREKFRVFSAISWIVLLSLWAPVET